MSRIKQLRLARGLSLDQLVETMGRLVSKQALSKYERGLSRPGPEIATRLAAALGVSTLQLWQPPEISVEIVGYRRLVGLGKKKCEQIKTTIAINLEKRCRLQERLGIKSDLSALVRSCPVARVEDAEVSAQWLRKKWKLGQDPIANLHTVLDNNAVHTFSIATERKFDGLCAIARDANGRAIAAALTTRAELPGDRQRMNLTHELGHLVLQPKNQPIEEKAAFRFAGAFLAPAEVLIQAVGIHRTNIQLTELIALKRHFKISIQALLYRMRDLGIIAPTYYQAWMIELGRRGWRKSEPEPIPPERSDWIAQMAARALAEGAITEAEARQSGEELPAPLLAAVASTQAEFLKLPLEERRKRLVAQAAALHVYYAEPHPP